MSIPDQWRNLSVPLIAAPMFLISGPKMVIECCRNGVIGSFPTPNARTSEILEEWLKEIVSSLTDSDAPWAVNLVVHKTNNRLYSDLELVKKYKPPIVITALGSPKPVIDAVHEYGGRVLADVNSLQHARKAAKAGVDGLVLVGAGAGGHTGYMTGFAFVPAIREFFDGVVVLGGGLMTGAAIRSAELLGADMALMGTRFIPCQESLASDDYRKMLIDVNFEDLVLTNKITGVPAYWIKQSLAMSGISLEAIQSDVSIDFTDPKGDARRWTKVWSAGHGVGAIRKIESVGNLIETLAENYWEAVNTPPFRVLPLSLGVARECTA
ncbi:MULTISPECIES: nitronate monooxygenase family protein [unclassified Pseudomonas]|uniref:NAD(P)H-dependent flavin oxidoreductase n=1 Tax=unclassified Pseudomonas TaxID=196821 RepID=UPI0006877068|nr:MULTISPECIES: nitronate monooxygenase [unclassified Pseudomonas]SMF65614.1 nitronate monooxygenase [Pseudomonas sp. LAMO17WK12:I1]